jgi:DNA-binding beta-propeller fold protein YncE
VTTLAGSATASASNGIGAAAGFSGPASVAVDSTGTLLFVGDYNNRLIRQIVIATQTVTTLAGSATAGAVNGIGVAARFDNPTSVAVDSSGNLFVADTGNNLVRKIVIATKEVTTLAGSGSAAWGDGFGTNADFSSPAGMAFARGFAVVVDRVNNRMRLMQPTVPCPAGVYCAPGTEAVACTPGYFCAAGADRALCALGYFCPSGSTSATQVACPSGAFHCPAGASAPVSIACAAGYDGLFVHREKIQN